MTTNNNNQPEDKAPTFKKYQKVWVKAEIDEQSSIDANIWCVNTKDENEEDFQFYTSISEIRTTAQILQEHGALAPQPATDGTINITLCLTEEEYKHLKCCVGWFETCGEYEEKINENIYFKLFNEHSAETPHIDEKTPHNAELPAQNAEPSEGNECWVKAEFVTTVSDDSRAVKFRDCEDNAHIIFMDEEDVRFTEPTHSTAIIELTEPDRTRKFRKGDKVRLVERWGRTPWLNCSNLELGETYTVYADEEVEDEEIYLEVYDNSEGISPFFLDLVEPTPEPKYWLHESPKTYSIYYKGQFGRVITAMLMQKDLYTLEEAQEQCEKLNKKEQNRGI